MSADRYFASPAPAAGTRRPVFLDAMPARARQRLGLSRTGTVTTPKVRLSQILSLAEHLGRTNDTSCLATWRETASSGEPDDTWAQLTQAMSVQDPMSLRSVEQLSVRTRGFFLAAAKLPARLVIEALTAHPAQINLLLGAVPDPAPRRELTSIGGETSYLVACCNVDLGDPEGAVRKLKLASDAAGQARDAALSAITLDGHSHSHAFNGDHRAALELVERGAQKSLVSGSPGTMAHLKLRAAEEHLALGNLRETAQAWQEAEAFYAGTDVQTDRNWIRLWLTPNGFDSVRTIVYEATGHRDEAVLIAQALAGRLNGALGKTDAVALVNATLTLARAGKEDEAAHAGQQALAAIWESEATGCMPRLHKIAQFVHVNGSATASWQAFTDDIQATQRRLDSIPPRPPASG